MGKQEAPKARIPILDYEADNHSAQLALNRFREGNMLHAYLLTGAEGLGKRTLAQILACTVFCKAQQKPCFHCAACKQVLEGNHPDVLTVYLKKDKATIGIDQIRDVISDVSRHSYGGSYRVVLMEPVDKMTPPAQNALLKSLEEPDSNVIFLLMAHEPSAALGTIASRCARIKLLPRSDDTLQNTLVQSGFSAESVAEAVRISDGNIGLAIKRLLKNKDDPADALLRQTLNAVSDADGLRLIALVKDQKEIAGDYLLQLEETLHRVVLVRSRVASPDLVNDLPLLWQKAAQSAPMEDLNRILEGIHYAEQQKASYVNLQSNLDQLLMIITEETSKWQKSLA